MTNKLSEYGHTFQIKSIACLMTDVGFVGQIYDILDEKHFDNDALTNAFPKGNSNNLLWRRS